MEKIKTDEPFPVHPFRIINLLFGRLICVHLCASRAPIRFYGTSALTSAEYALSVLLESTEVTTK